MHATSIKYNAQRVDWPGIAESLGLAIAIGLVVAFLVTLGLDTMDHAARIDARALGGR